MGADLMARSEHDSDSKLRGRSLAWRQLQAAEDTSDSSSYHLHSPTRHVYTPFSGPLKGQLRVQTQTQTCTSSTRSTDPSNTQSAHPEHTGADKDDADADDAGLGACGGDTLDAYLQSSGPLHVVPPPSSGADVNVKMQFLNYQLDSLGQSTDVLDGLLLNGGGPQDRLEGAHALVQMARCRRNARQEFAVKFYLQSQEFAAESALYQNRRKPSHSFLPQVRNIVENTDGKFVDPCGHPLPPCIVMERGESLDKWQARARPDRMQACSIIQHVAARLEAMHAVGYVHRDLKPANVMWLPRENRWTLIDFGCAARTGTRAALSFTKRYAAPEVVDAMQRGNTVHHVDEALDAWSLGVMAFELLSGRPAFEVSLSKHEVLDSLQACNGRCMAWETHSAHSPPIEEQLGIFCAPVLGLLRRDPAQRHSMKRSCAACHQLLTPATPSGTLRDSVSIQSPTGSSDESAPLGSVTLEQPRHTHTVTSSFPSLPRGRGRHTHTSAANTAGVADVADLCKLLSRGPRDADVALAGKALHLRPQRRLFGGPDHCGPHARKWLAAPIWPTQTVVSTAAANDGMFTLCSAAPRHMVVCTLAGSNTHLSQCSLHMPERSACVVLDSSCSGWRMSNMQMHGALVVCYGSSCNVTFESVTFTNCTVLVVAGAQAILHSCSFSRPTATCQGVAVYAHGSGTQVRMHGGSICGGAQGVTVQSGAVCDLSSVTVAQCLVLGVEVKDCGSRLQLSSCDLRQFPSGSCSDSVVRGVYAHSGGTLELRNSTVASVQFGVVARSGAQVYLTESTISNASVTCIVFSCGAQGYLTDCNVLWSQTGHGMHVAGSGSCAQASGCKFVQHAKCGIFAQNGARVTANACSTTGSKFSGYSTQSDACMELTECSSDVDVLGCAVSTGGTLGASHVVISDCVEEGVTVRKGGVGTLTGCSIRKCGEQGVRVSDQRSVLAMHSCTVAEAQLSCVALMHGARGRLQGCTLEGSVTRSGVVAENENTELNIEACTLRGNAECGVLSNDEAVVVAMACQCMENTGSSGFSAQSRAKLTVRDSSCMREKRGVGVFDGGRLSADNLTVDGVVSKSFSL